MCHFYKLICILSIAALLLTGCYTTTTPCATDNTQDTASDTQTPTVTPTEAAGNDVDVEPEQKIYKTYPAPDLYSEAATPGSYPVPAENGGFYYIRFGGTSVNYVLEEGTKSVLCGIGGCSHNDASCPAFYPELNGFVSRNGMWYVLCADQMGQGNTAELLAVDPSDGKRTTLCRWTAPENCSLSGREFICTDETAFVSLSYDNNAEMTTTCVVESISLQSGEKQTLRTLERGTIGIMGAVSAGVVLRTTTLTEPPIDYETYLALHPNATEEEYGDYWFAAEKQNTEYKLELVGTDGGLLDTLATTENGYVCTINSKICWNEYVAYQRNGTVYCYDSTTQEARALDVEKSPVNIRFSDGRLCLTYPEDGDMYRYVFYDIHTGETIEFAKGDVIFFSVKQETDDSFVGFLSDKDGTFLISKQSFYNEDADVAVLLLQN